jgi:hypothetical protein
LCSLPEANELLNYTGIINDDLIGVCNRPRMKNKNSDTKKVVPNSDVEMTEMTEVGHDGNDHAKETTRLNEVQIAIPTAAAIEQQKSNNGTQESPIHMGSKDSFLSWHNVGFTVKVKNGKVKQDKVLLADNSGRVNAGQVIAIMGGSGNQPFFPTFKA